MPRVLHVNDRAPDALGGAEILMARTCALLRQAGWEVQTFTEADLPDRRLTAIRYLHNRVARTALRHKLEDFRPNVVHLHNYYHLLSPAILPILADYKRKAPARIVMTAHDYHLICPNSGGNWFRRGPRLADLERLRSWTYLLSRRWDHRGLAYSSLKLLQHLWSYRLHDYRKSIDLVVCTCKFLRDAVRRIGLPAVHLRNPSPPVPSCSGARPSQLTLAFAGRVEPEKGIRHFLTILPADFPGRLLIVGDGSDRPACEALCRVRGIADRVVFLGRRSHTETLAVLAQAHVVVVPSLLFETYPLVAQEALTLGTNILVADYGGMREIVLDSGIGYRFDPERPTTLADQLLAIQSAFADGSLNRFDAAGFLAGRTEADYQAGLLRVYVGEEP